MPTWWDLVVAFCSGWLLRVWYGHHDRLANRTALDGSHLYLSSACYHERHQLCSHVCAFCPSHCTCPCHTGVDPTRG
jgi:hypothetical protein